VSKNIVELKDIVVSYDGEQILKGINLDIKDKEFITLLGPSGCGKTTTLRIIGGFVSPDSGDVLFDGKKINDVPPHKRNVNTVFQRYALFPHLNVFDNVAFGLRINKTPESEIKTRVLDMLQLVDLKGFEKRKVSKLSGGQQQRVAIARALVNAPSVLLLDEPLGALDLKLRKDMQIELKKIQQKLKITFIYVTHDQEEALTMSDEVVVMKDGTIQQIGSPQDIYNEPVNAFVADFIGENNIVDGVMKKDYLVSFCGHDFDCVDGGFSENESVDVVVRPEDVEVVPSIQGDISGTVLSAGFKGVHYEMIVDCGGFQWLIHSTVSQRAGDEIGLKISPDSIHIMKKMLPFDENTLKGKCVSFDEETSLWTVETPDGEISLKYDGDLEDRNLILTFQPEDIEIMPENQGDFNGYLESVIDKASYIEMIVSTENQKYLIKSQKDEQVGTTVSLKFNPEKAVVVISEENADEI
jgi:spermidine/putrescine transport system ATP-binding protein